MNKEFLTKNLIAHRGIHYKYIENSIKAFKEAIKRNYTIELDIHLTKDKKIIVFHDNNLKRLTGIFKNIEESNYQEIKKIISVPTIEEVLSIVNGKVPIIIETKNKKVGELEQKLSNILDKYNGNFAIQSFNYKSLQWFKQNKKEYLTGFLINSVTSKNIIIKYLLNSKIINKKIKPTYIGVNLDYIDNKNIKKIKNKYLIIGYTINNQKEFSKYVYKTDNLICNIQKYPYIKKQKQRD